MGLEMFDMTVMQFVEDHLNNLLTPSSINSVMIFVKAKLLTPSSINSVMIFVKAKLLTPSSINSVMIFK
jgi:hypothetical protein